MSASAALTRVGQIESLIGTLRSAPVGTPAPAAGQDFASMLQASGTSAATAPTASVASVAVPATTTTAAAGDASPYDALIDASAQRNGIDPALLKGLIRQESNFDPTAGSSAGAQGLTQLMPGTAAALGVGNPSDPAQSIEGGARYLRQQLDHFGGDTTKALAAYNAGPGAVERFGGVPPYAETQGYVQHVLAYAQEYRSQTPTPTVS
jgi:soluble lytic murein transglycosylase-like protein